MRQILLPFAAVLATASFLSAAPKATPEQVAKDWADAYNANDPEKNLAFYDRSGPVEVIVSDGTKRVGIEAVEKLYREEAGEVRFSDSTAENIASRVLDDTAVVTFEHKFRMADPKSGKEFQAHIRTTIVLHQVEGKWKIVFEHSSGIEGIPRYLPLGE